MRTIQGYILRCLITIQVFLDENAARLTTLVNSATRKELDACIAALQEHASEQADHTLTLRGATNVNRTLRTILRQDHMQPIARLAALYLPRTPEFVALRMPSNNLSPQRLAVVAMAMGKKASEHAAVFADGGLAPTFVADLDAATNAMLANVGTTHSSRVRRTTATKGIAMYVSRGRAVVRAIDPIVRKTFRGDGEMLRAWESASHVTKRPSRSTAGVQTPVAPSVAAIPVDTATGVAGGVAA